MAKAKLLTYDGEEITYDITLVKIFRLLGIPAYTKIWHHLENTHFEQASAIICNVDIEEISRAYLLPNERSTR